MTGKEWLNQQKDTIFCKYLNCRMTLRACHARQKDHYRYQMFPIGEEIRINAMFVACRKCKHFLPDEQVPGLEPPNTNFYAGVCND